MFTASARRVLFSFSSSSFVLRRLRSPCCISGARHVLLYVLFFSLSGVVSRRSTVHRALSPTLLPPHLPIHRLLSLETADDQHSNNKLVALEERFFPPTLPSKYPITYIYHVQCNVRKQQQQYTRKPGDKTRMPPGDHKSKFTWY